MIVDTLLFQSIVRKMKVVLLFLKNLNLKKQKALKHMKKTETELARAEQIASEILSLSRNTLLVNMRFLDMAISRVALVSQPEGSMSTDGQFFYYRPLFVMQKYKEQSESMVRGYLHVILHCVFRHNFINTLVNKDYWNLACDIAVENSITELGLSSTETVQSASQQRTLFTLKEHIKPFTAEKIYAYFLKNPPNPVELHQMTVMFYFDDHTIWYGKEDESNFNIEEGYGNDEGRSEGNRGVSSGKGKLNEDDEEKEKGKGSTEDSNNDNGENGDPMPDSIDKTKHGNKERHLSRQELEQIWKNVSERMQTDLETASRQWGNNALGLTQELRAVNRERYDYKEFLRKFSVLGEAMQINDDEFDYIFYTYGMRLYKNMPLIEPLEYKEDHRLKEFVIAIDTSGSTSGDLVQKFVTKTYNILKQHDSFFTKTNLHIIQCDVAVQEDKKITCEEDFDDYIKTMQLHGMGGTDFRPVFSYIDELIAKKEFSNLKGLIYFTDGLGTFPERKPDYDTAFVFLDDGTGELPQVPVWAMRLVLQSDDI